MNPTLNIILFVATIVGLYYYSQLLVKSVRKGEELLKDNKFRVIMWVILAILLSVLTVLQL